MSVGRFLRGTGPRPNPGPSPYEPRWTVTRAPSGAGVPGPGDAPAPEVVGYAPSLAEARAEVDPALGAVRPLDVVTLLPPPGGGTPETWFVRDDGRAVPLPPLPAPDGDDRADWARPFRAGRAWGWAWYEVPRGSRLLALARESGAAPRPFFAPVAKALGGLPRPEGDPVRRFLEGRPVGAAELDARAVALEEAAIAASTGGEASAAEAADDARGQASLAWAAAAALGAEAGDANARVQAFWHLKDAATLATTGGDVQLGDELRRAVPLAAVLTALTDGT